MPEHADVGAFVLGALDPDDEGTFREHLRDCESCRREVDELSKLPGLLDRAAPPVEVPHGLRERTMRAVWSGRQTARRGRPGRVVTSLAAAAVTLVAAGVVVRQVRQGSYETITLVAAEQGDARGVAKVRRTPTGREVDLEVEGLPPSGGGTFYECWFVGEGDSLDRPNRVSVGTFKVGADGKAGVRMTSSADPAEFPRMGVTREPDDGDPQRTGDKVLVQRE